MEREREKAVGKTGGMTVNEAEFLDSFSDFYLGETRSHCWRGWMSNYKSR